MLHVKKLLRSPRFYPLMILWCATAVSCLFIFRSFLFGGQLVVFNDAASDTRQQYLMQYATIINHLRSGNLSMWDLNNGFGTSMFALNPFHIFLMPVYLLGFLRGAGHTATALLYMTILQIFLAGTFCYLFLDCFSFSEPGKVISSYIYAFNGYLIVWGQHYHFGGFAVMLPLLLFLLERAIRRKSCSIGVPLLVAMMTMSSVYMSYMSLIMAGAYLLFRSIFEDGARKARVRMFFMHCAEMVLGIGIGAFAFLPSARYLLTISTRLESGTPFLKRILQYCSLFSGKFYRTAFLRLFSTTYEGILDYRGYSNFYEAPILFFSVLFVFLSLQYLFTIHRQTVSIKAKLLQYLAVLLYLFCMFVCLGASIFNAFAYPFSRHSFLFMPLFALVTAMTLDQIFIRRRVHLPALLLSAALTVYAHWIAVQRMTESELKKGAVITLLLASAMAGLLLLSRYADRLRRPLRRALPVLLFFCVMINISQESWLCYNHRDTLSKSDPDYWGGLYDPDVTAALDYLRETDPSLFRLEKDYYSGSFCMDSAAQGYRGISTYNGTPNRNLEQFIQLAMPNFSIMAKYEYTYRQIGNYTGYNTLFGIRYLLSRNPELRLDGFSFERQFGGLSLYRNENVSSFARFYTDAGDSAVLKDAYGKADLETMLLDVALLDLEEDTQTQALIKKITGKEPLSKEELLAGYELEEITRFRNQKADGTGASLTIPLDRTVLDDFEHVYLEFDIKTPETSDITVNPEYPLEYHFRTTPGRQQHVQVPVPASCQEITFERYGGALTGRFRNLRLLGSRRVPKQASQAEITLMDPTKDSVLSGSITAETSGFLFLPIPFEDGWTASLDGETAEILRTDAGFLSIPVSAGSHSFTFTYRQPLMREGIWISILSLAVWVLLAVFRKKRLPELSVLRNPS